MLSVDKRTEFGEKIRALFELEADVVTDLDSNFLEKLFLKFCDGIFPTKLELARFNSIYDRVFGVDLPLYDCSVLDNKRRMLDEKLREYKHLLSESDDMVSSD